MKNITDELADVFLKNNIDAVGGNLLCSTCYIKAMKMETTLIESSDHSASSDKLSVLSRSFCRSKAIEEVNTQISDNFPDIPPIKLHSISQTRSSSGLYAAKRKLKQVNEKVKAKKQSLQKILNWFLKLNQENLRKILSRRKKKTMKIWTV